MVTCQTGHKQLIPLWYPVNLFFSSIFVQSCFSFNSLYLYLAKVSYIIYISIDQLYKYEIEKKYILCKIAIYNFRKLTYKNELQIKFKI